MKFELFLVFIIPPYINITEDVQIEKSIRLSTFYFYLYENIN